MNSEKSPFRALRRLTEENRDENKQAGKAILVGVRVFGDLGDIPFRSGMHSKLSSSRSSACSTRSVARYLWVAITRSRIQS